MNCCTIVFRMPGGGVELHRLYKKGLIKVRSEDQSYKGLYSTKKSSPPHLLEYTYIIMDGTRDDVYMCTVNKTKNTMCMNSQNGYRSAQNMQILRVHRE